MSDTTPILATSNGQGACPHCGQSWEQWEPLRRLDRDLKAAARLMGRREVRALVDLYYQIQEFRKASANQVRSAASGEPNQVISWVFDSTRRLEDDIKKALDEFSSEYRVGQWAKSITGIGPVITAGLLTHIDIRKAPTVGHIWRFAGLDPTVKWAKKSKRPWNAALKRLAFLAGDCFVKFKGNRNDHYGHIYTKRKEYETAINDRCGYADQAEAALKEKNYGKDTEARRWYEQGKLPPARLHMRALRYAAKMFLSHLHTVMYRDYYDADPPVPYAFEHSDGDHRHYVPLPVPFEGFDGKTLKEMFE